jgi:hypothetical protein
MTWVRGRPPRAGGRRQEAGGRGPSPRWYTTEEEPPRRAGLYLTRRDVYLLPQLWDRGRWHALGRDPLGDGGGRVTHWAPLPASSADLDRLARAADALDA